MTTYMCLGMLSFIEIHLARSEWVHEKSFARSRPIAKSSIEEGVRPYAGYPLFHGSIRACISYADGIRIPHCG
jgi:hypothetical protein